MVSIADSPSYFTKARSGVPLCSFQGQWAFFLGLRRILSKRLIQISSHIDALIRIQDFTRSVCKQAFSLVYFKYRHSEYLLHQLEIQLRTGAENIRRLHKQIQFIETYLRCCAHLRENCLICSDYWDYTL